MKRAVIVVLDSVGIGELPDAHLFGDEGSNTLVNIKKARPDMELKNLCSLGLGNIDGKDIDILGKIDSPVGCYGKMAEKSIGKDTTTGHWEMAGVITEKPFPTFTKNGFPKEIMEKFEAAIGRKSLGNYAVSGTEVIKTLGDEHVKTGFPIVYTSADSVFQIAAHESVIPLPLLYEMCTKAREILTGEFGVARVIARPFVGESGNYTRTTNRRDFSLPPTGKTILDLSKEKGQTTVAVGKISDIFQNKGVSLSIHTSGNSDGIKKTIDFLKTEFKGILFTNLVDYDMLYGHRNDVLGYSNALIEFDNALPEIMNTLSEDDILFITADHGCDPTTPSTDHSREYVPILVYGKNVKENINLGIRATFSDLGETISDYLALGANFAGKSFLKEILKWGGFVNIDILNLSEGARKAKGIAVIIDVFRAFTTACVAMNNNAKTIIPVAEIDLAYKLKKNNPSYILIGERNEKILEGFDFGNSPTQIENVDFSGKTIIHTTSAGTQGISNAFNADEILTGSLSNALAISKYIKHKNPRFVSLVCMGKANLYSIEEDTYCAKYIESLLKETNYPIEEKIKELRFLEGKRFFNPNNQDNCPERDFEICTSINKFNFVLKAQKTKGNLYNLEKLII